MHPSCRRNNTTMSSSCSILYLPIFIIYIALNPFFFSKNIINEKENMTNFMILKKIFQLQTFLVDFSYGDYFFSFTYWNDKNINKKDGEQSMFTKWTHLLTLGDINLLAKSKTGVGSNLLVSCHIYCLIQPSKKIFEVGKIQLRLIWIIEKRAWKLPPGIIRRGWN